jgi:hypothetical protein
VLLVAGFGGQTLAAQDVRAAFTGGLVVSTMAGVDTLRQPGATHLGWAAGFVVDLRLRGGLGIVIGGQHAEKGYGDKRSGVSTAYWEVPILVRYRFAGDWTGIAPSLGFGLAPAWQARCRAYMHVVRSTPSLSFPYVGDYIQESDCQGLHMDGTDLGAIGTAGIMRTTGQVRWSLEVRYTLGLANLARAYGGSSWRNRSASLLLSIGAVPHAGRQRMPN